MDFKTEKRYKVYLAKLKRTNAEPRVVYKVGITSSKDAMTRLNYRGMDEPFPISEHFSDIKVMYSTKQKYTRLEAEHLEKTIMMGICKDKNEEFFHNWWEPNKISGITEMRVWDYDEIQKIFTFFEKTEKNS